MLKPSPCAGGAEILVDPVRRHEALVEGSAGGGVGPGAGAGAGEQRPGGGGQQQEQEQEQEQEQGQGGELQHGDQPSQH